jgi:translation initiation factor IF-3
MRKGDLRERAHGPRVNHAIRVPEVRVVDADSKNLGVLPTYEAKRRASEQGLDLVEINPKAFPPVCKIIDYGKWKYDQKKAENEQKKRRTVIEVKEIKLRPKTDDHDLQTKAQHCRRFLMDSDKVKLTCRFRGREITHPEVAHDQLARIAEMVSDVGKIEMPARMEGRTLTMMLAPQ